MEINVASRVVQPTTLHPENASRKQATIDIALFAPHNEHVELIAQWNDWKPQPMSKGDDGWWRVPVTLEDGEHLYRFRVKSTSYFANGEMLDISDPYALQVRPDQDENAVLRIKDGKRVWTTYEWKHDAVPLPTNDKLVIYEMHIGDFTGTKEKTGTFLGAIEKLDYIKSLGINAVELMPVKEFPGRGWGYSLKSLFGVENSYGTPDDLCRFIDECHRMGIRVIIDGVYNHAHADAYLAKIAYEYWFYRTNPDGPEMDWGPKYNFEHFDSVYNLFPARKYVIDSLLFWVEKFHIDGIRFDATAAIKNFDIMREFTDAAYSKVEERKPFICIAEHVPQDPEITGRERGRPMDAAWHEPLGRLLQAVISFTEQGGQKPQDLDALSKMLDPATNGYGLATRAVSFVGNHDYKRPMTILGEEGHLFGDAAFRRMKIGHALLLTAPGIPMIWMGTEFGMPSDKSLDPMPLDWSLLDNHDNSDLLEFHRRLVALRNCDPALRSDFFQTLLADQERQLFAFKRWTDNGSVTIVVANLKDDDVGEITLPVEGLDGFEFDDAVEGGRFKAEANAIKLTLGKSQVRVLASVPQKS